MRLLLLLLLLTTSVYADTLTIGIKITPGFIDRSDQGYSGIAVDQWNKLNIPTKYVEYKNIFQLLNAVRDKEIHGTINPITVTRSRLNEFNFTLPYYVGNVGLAKKHESFWLRHIKVIIAALFFVFLCSIAFSAHERISFWDGAWLTLMIASTVGYGSIALKTVVGRLTAIVIILVVFSSVISEFHNTDTLNINDVNVVATVVGSDSHEYAKNNNIAYYAYNSLSEALGSKEAYILYDASVLKRIGLEPTKLKSSYYSFILPKPFIDYANRAIVNH